MTADMFITFVRLFGGNKDRFADRELLRTSADDGRRFSSAAAAAAAEVRGGGGGVEVSTLWGSLSCFEMTFHIFPLKDGG